MRVLHITNWYPSEIFPHNAKWIKRQIESLPDSVSNKVYHVEILTGNFKIRKYSSEDNQVGILIWIPFNFWRIKEWIYTLVVYYITKWKENLDTYDVVNFHITYPLLTNIKLLRYLRRKPILVNEHWSAYHYNFNVKNTNKLRRIREIFNEPFRWAPVSEALAKDLRQFSGNDKLKISVIPNIVDTNRFDHRRQMKSSHFLMVGLWKWPKNPFLVLSTVREMVDNGNPISLKVGGYGPQLAEMEIFVKENRLEDYVEFLGMLTSEMVAAEMNNARAYIHPSEYETFSVVCVEALACGTPVIASNVGAIPEYLIPGENGYLFNNLNSDLQKCIEQFMEHGVSLGPSEISENVQQSFGSKAVSDKYLETLELTIS